MQRERLFLLLDLLIEKGRLSAPELAARFEVSARTIYRDIECLERAGVPLSATVGSKGGYELDGDYRLDRSFLTPEELADLTGTLRGFAEALKDERLGRSLGKLAGLGRGLERQEPIQGRGRPRRLLGRADDGPRPSHGGNRGPAAPPLIVSLGPKGGSSADASLVESIRDAIGEARLVRLSYRDLAGERSERVVEPYSLVLGGAIWYLHAFCRLREAYRLFRLSRVVSANTLAERFDPWERAPIPSPWDSQTKETMIRVRLRGPLSMETVLGEILGASVVSRGDEGVVEATFEYPESDWLLRFLLSLGPGIEVLEPMAFRERIRDAARRIVEDNG